MKKYLITSAAALALCGLITSCTHEFDAELSAQNSVVQKYEEAFITAFGKPDPNQEWGFGPSTVVGTRGTRAETFGFSLPQDYANNPGFKKKSNIKDLTSSTYAISQPTLGKNLLDEITNNSSVDYAANDNSLSNNGTYYINSSSDLQNPQNFDNLTIYINDNNMTFWKSLKSGSTIVICKDKNVTLNSVNENNTIYVAPDATLNFNSDVTLKNCRLFLASGSTLNAKGLTVMTQNNGTCEIVNNGGTINVGSQNEAKSICFDNFTGTFWNGGTLKVYGSYYTQNGEGGNFYNGSGCNITATNIKLYKSTNFRNEGNITLSSSDGFYADQYGHNIYNSGTITTQNLTLEKNITLWNEGTFNVTNALTYRNDNIDVYNGPNSTMKMKSLDLYNNYQLIVNDGSLEVEGDILARNTSAEIINNGTLTGASLTLLAGAKFHNTADVTISGKTHIANSQSPWKNEGRYTTGDFEVSDYAKMVYNNCSLTVHKTGDTGVFKIYGEFVVGGGGSVVTDNVDWVNKSNVYLGNLSLFKVKETFDSDNKDTECGIHAMGDEWAVLQAKSIVQRNNVNDQYRMSYYGNLWVDAESHFDLWYKDQSTTPGKQPNYERFGNAKFGHEGDEGCPVIPADKTKSCTPGYNETPEPSGDVVRVVAEDLTATTGTDFDFNDVVFDVWLHPTFADQVMIKLRAAGGTLPLYIGEGSEVREVHELFKQDTNMMINTGGSYANCIDGLAPVGFSLPNPLKGKAGADDVKQVAKAIKLQVRKNVKGVSTLCELTAVKGQAPAKLCVGTDFPYPDDDTYTYPCLKERTDIQGAFKYNPTDNINSKYKGEGKFSLYVKGIFDDNWYKSTAQPKSQPQSND